MRNHFSRRDLAEFRIKIGLFTEKAVTEVIRKTFDMNKLQPSATPRPSQGLTWKEIPMDRNCNTHFENSPVSQLPRQDTDMDLWEPQFERWLRLADSVLGNLPRERPIAPRKN